MVNGTRDELLSRLAEAVGSIAMAHPTLVAVDGPPAAGKTTLADELAVVLRAQGRDVIRASIDDFLQPRTQRYRRGEYSAEANYYDSHDYDALRRVLLDPLGPGADRRFRPATYDDDTDTTLSLAVTTAADDAVLLFDGVFLLRPELLDLWHLRIFVSTTFEETLHRARARDLAAFGSASQVEYRYRNRYLPAQQLYNDAARPTEHADIIVQNDEPHQPTWEPGRRPLHPGGVARWTEDHRREEMTPNPATIDVAGVSSQRARPISVADSVRTEAP